MNHINIETQIDIKTAAEVGASKWTARSIALVAHDNKKDDLLDWAKFNKDLLSEHRLVATGTTGTRLEEIGLYVRKFMSGPLGGDQQIGAAIAQNEIDMLVFFWDPMQQQPHDPDVKALLRIATLWNVGIAVNRTSADLMISSPLFEDDYNFVRPDLGIRHPS
jgi:methylglyoxal synthase